MKEREKQAKEAKDKQRKDGQAAQPQLDADGKEIKGDDQLEREVSGKSFYFSWASGVTSWLVVIPCFLQ